MRGSLIFVVLAVCVCAFAADDNWGFEKGLKGWKAEGTAFSSQPTFEDNIAPRRGGVLSNIDGKYWIGTAENRPNGKAAVGTTQGDGPTGTLTSDRFKIDKQILRFLIGGGANAEAARVELLVLPSEGPNVPKDFSVGGLLGAATKKRPGIEKAVVVRIAAAANDDTMGWVEWDLSEFKGLDAWLRIVDDGSGEMDHINVDAFQFVDAGAPMGAIPALSPEAAAEHERYMAMLTPEAKAKVQEGANELAAATFAGLPQDQYATKALEIGKARFPTINDAEGQNAVALLIMGEAAKLGNQQLNTATTDVQTAQGLRLSLKEALKRATTATAQQIAGGLVSNVTNFGANGLSLSNIALPDLTMAKGMFLSNLSSQFPGVPNLANLPSDWQTLSGEALRAAAPHIGANVQLVNAFVDYMMLRRQMGVTRSQALIYAVQPMIQEKLGKLDSIVQGIKV